MEESGGATRSVPVGADTYPASVGKYKGSDIDCIAAGVLAPVSFLSSYASAIGRSQMLDPHHSRTQYRFRLRLHPMLQPPGEPGIDRAGRLGAARRERHIGPGRCSQNLTIRSPASAFANRRKRFDRDAATSEEGATFRQVFAQVGELATRGPTRRISKP
ncbi:hypothetical protein GCM10011494_24710 [Novosphingobium endophyticum]|uniref:Uncharacterized protein n=1 Tax=Novosphingobium endophyticum TaxID=1955250 RepID=A0A916X608_9SPHN|nr:hypothetical protein GCM10011494_24710 [Novosphingobium endophyticum]